MGDKEWLAGLKPGDTVIVSGGYDRRDRARKVERMTPTQIVVGTSRYDRATGKLRGDSIYFCRLCQPTPERVAQARTVELVETLRQVDWNVQPLETLEWVAAMVAKNKEGVVQL